MDLTKRIAQLERWALLVTAALGESRHFAALGKLVSQMPGASADAHDTSCRYANGCPHPGFCTDTCHGRFTQLSDPWPSDIAHDLERIKQEPPGDVM